MNKEELKYEARITAYTFLASLVFFPSLLWLIFLRGADDADPYVEWIKEFYPYLCRPGFEFIIAWIILLFPPFVLQVIRSTIYYWRDPRKLKDVFRIHKTGRKGHGPEGR